MEGEIQEIKEEVKEEIQVIENEIKKNVFGDRKFFFGLAGGIGAVIIVGIIIIALAFVFRGKGNDKIVIGNSQPQLTSQGPTTVKVTAKGISTFSMKKDATICKENGKPVVYLFSTTWCPHCEWIKAIFDSTMAKYVQAGKIVAYHYQVDTGDNTLTPNAETQVPASAQAVYSEFNPGGSIPTFVFGCKYFRVGNGYEAQNDLASEVKEFEAVIKDITK